MIKVDYILTGMLILAGVTIIGLIVIHIIDTIVKNRFKNSVIKMNIKPDDKILLRIKFDYCTSEQVRKFKEMISSFLEIPEENLFIVDNQTLQQVIIFNKERNKNGNN